MHIRLLEPRDRQSWAEMRVALWPEEDADELTHETLAHFAGKPVEEAVFVAEDAKGKLIGMLELGLRAQAEGCRTSPVPFIEAWFVSVEARHKGVGRALVAAAEHWAILRNFSEIASDAQIGNAGSLAAHAGLGFEEVDRIVCYRKPLRV